MRTHEIIRRFIRYFADHGHTVVPSASLILDDPTLLFVNAGMVPFKPYFLGEAPAPFRRATSVQKCVRTADIARIGRTSRHNTFFQMAGNFSFGDYFKAGAIEHAWRVVTETYRLDADRIWVTVHRDDDEAATLWRSIAGLPPERIQRRGGKDNYWDMGVPGPAGPSSEIYYDLGPEHGPEGGPAVDENRYLEIWNLVFMHQVRGERSPKDGYPPVGALPTRNIDTGLGVERLATLLQGVANVYETDLVRPVITKTEELTGSRYGANADNDVRFRVVGDHARAAVMIAGDGVTPSNEGRGYVLRRLLRRIVHSARMLGAHEPVLEALARVVCEVMSPSYPELAADLERILSVVRAEEEAFSTTLRTGARIFDAAVAETKTSGGTQLPADTAFTLHDTYGFPIELTLDLAAEAGLTVDEPGFRALMAKQQARAKADAEARKAGAGTRPYRALLDTFAGKDASTEFLAYTHIAAEARILGLIVGGAVVAAAAEGTAVEVVLDRTPFYPEGGGQLADTGVITGSGFRIAIADVQQPMPGLIVHHGTVTTGEATSDALVHAEIDVDRRASLSRSHSATHLIHTGVRRALGEHAAQAGSLNAPGRLRFDFTAPGGGVPVSVLGDVEDEVNVFLQTDAEVRWFRTSLQEARRLGALSLFGEKYGESVRVVEIGDYSRELCVGTHVARSGQLGLIKLLGQSSIGSGVRRVEALVGLDAFRFLAREHVLVAQLTEQFRARPDELPERIGGVVERLRRAERELAKLRAEALRASAARLADNAENLGGIALVATRVEDDLDMGSLRAHAAQVRGHLGPKPGLVALFSVAGGKTSFVIATTAAARERDIAAADIVALIAPILGGRGGGGPDLAQGGGGEPRRIPDAISALRREISPDS